jgi:zinc protease
MMHRSLLLLLLLTFFAPIDAEAKKSPQVVTLDSTSPLVEIRIMVRAGSMHDPVGKEGLAAITASALLEGGFGEVAEPVTKEDVARLTSAWGQGARPSVQVGKEVTTLSMTVPRDVLSRFTEEVLAPMLDRPLFLEDEVTRLRNEARTFLTGALRSTMTEMLGLEALDNYVYDGTSMGHTVRGSVQGLAAITTADVRGFFNAHYRAENTIVGLSTEDRAVRELVLGALARSATAQGPSVRPKTPRAQKASAVRGREAVVVKLPDSGATGVHFGFPLAIDRRHPDFWPLWVANVHFGTHRDSHGLLYTLIRQERGYNYGDYSYVEHFPFRPWALFPAFNYPRTQQYFSVWVRPVASDHAHHLLKATVYELEQLVAKGLTPEQVELSRNKAKVLYLNYAETASRLLASKLDDAYLGLEPGYLEGYLERMDAVTVEQVNAALRTYLSTENLKIVVVAEAHRAEEIAQSLRDDGVVYGKGPADYQFETATSADGGLVYEVTEDRIETLRRDAVWAHHRLHLDPARVRVVEVDQLFETGNFVTPEGDRAN